MAFRFEIIGLHLCSRNLAKVEVAGSSPVSRSISPVLLSGYMFGRTKTHRLNKNRDKNSEFPAQHRLVEDHIDLAVR